MGAVRKPRQVKLFAGIILQRDIDLAAVLDALTPVMGAIEEQAPPLPFTYTTYYDKEMGPGLLRTFVLASPLVDREVLPDIKLATNEIESSFSSDGKRRVNIDPGYVALEHVILATTKGYAHRVYLREGIYADLTLRYIDGTYRVLDWTYPDYREDRTISLAVEWREKLKRMLKCQKA